VPEVFTSLVDRLGPAPDLDHAWGPWVDAGEVVDHEGGVAGGPYVAELLRRGHAESADVDHVFLGGVAEGDRHDVRSAVTADRRQPSEALAGQIVDLWLRESCHDDDSTTSSPLQVQSRANPPAIVSLESSRPVGARLLRMTGGDSSQFAAGSSRATPTGVGHQRPH
jgi:hypothetical protein